MSATKEERDRLIALFELYGWLPMSARHHGNNTRETLLCRQSDGAILRRVVKAGEHIGIFNNKSPIKARMENREPRQWSDVPLPALRLMHARLLKRIAKECSDARKDEAS